MATICQLWGNAKAGGEAAVLRLLFWEVILLGDIPSFSCGDDISSFGYSVLDEYTPYNLLAWRLYKGSGYGASIGIWVERVQTVWDLWGGGGGLEGVYKASFFKR